MILLTDSNQRKVIDSYVGSIIAALPSPDSSFAGDQTALKEDMVARMLEYSEAESDYCALFPVLWGILREEMRTSNPDAGVSKAALLVLGGSCELRLTLSDAQSTVEVPANVLSSLDEYLNEQIAGSCLVIPLLLGTVCKEVLYILFGCHSCYCNKFKKLIRHWDFQPPVEFFFSVCVDLVMFDACFQINWWFQGWNAVKRESAQVSNCNHWPTSKRQFPAVV